MGNAGPTTKQNVLTPWGKFNELESDSEPPRGIQGGFPYFTALEGRLLFKDYFADWRLFSVFSGKYSVVFPVFLDQDSFGFSNSDLLDKI